MVGTWETTAPDGSKSVKKNETILQNNTTYVKANLDLDHYWDDSSTTDGYHRKISMVDQVSDPSIPGSMDGLIYLLENVSSQPHFRNADSIMQLLGIRAMVVWSGASTIDYQYNVASVAQGSTGFFTITYTTALPNTNYLVLGNAIRNNSSSSSEMVFSMQGATALSSVKTTGLCKVQIKSDGGTGHTPLQAWAVIFGG